MKKCFEKRRKKILQLRFQSVGCSIITLLQMSEGSLVFFNTFTSKPWFLCVCSTSLLKTLGEKKKLLVTSNFSFSQSVFYPLRKLSSIFIEFKNCHLHTLSVWKRLNFVAWERAKQYFLSFYLKIEWDSYTMNSFPYDRILESFNSNSICGQQNKFNSNDSERLENIVRKGGIAGYHHFPLLPQNFHTLLIINPFANKPWFSHICSMSLLKTPWVKEKLLVTSNFSFTQCFLPFWRAFCHFHQIWNCCLQTLSVWKGLKFGIWERVKTWDSEVKD